MTGPNVYHKQKTEIKKTTSEFVLSFKSFEYKKSKDHNKPFDIEELETILSTFNNTGFWIGKDEYNNIELFEKNFWELEKSKQAMCLISKACVHKLLSTLPVAV